VIRCPGMEAPLLKGPGDEQGRRSRSHSQDVAARSRQVHVSRIANSPFRGRIGGQCFPGVLCLQRTALGRSHYLRL
jgi:hypothetical protein